MQLMARLILQLIGVVLLCLLVTAGGVMTNVHRSIEEETAASSERVAHGLANLFWREILWRQSLRGDRLLLPSPEWETLSTLKLVSPGVCVTFHPTEPQAARTLCSQTEGVGTPAPEWFSMAYRGFFGPEPSVATPVSIKEPGAVVTATPEPTAVVRQAWRQVSVILTIASAMAIGICLLAAAVIAHALAPTERVVGGLRRLADGDYRHRAQIDSKGEFGLISRAVNDLASRLAQASAERVALTKRLFEVQEEERRALARDLHDEFGQCLTATIAFASSIKARASDRPDLAKDADAVIGTAKRMMTTLREALARLRSQDLEEVGLEASLVHLVAGWNAQAAPSAMVHLDLLGDLDTLPQPVSTNIYRIAQECLTNAMRHGKPGDIRLRVERLISEEGFIALTVEDDGGGDPSRLSAAPGHGILGVQERVAAFGGSVRIGPSARGVRVSARIPLTAPSRQTTRIAA
jgi:signal transduction histidine kinase